MLDIITIGSATLDVFVKAKAELLSSHKHLDVCYPLGSKVLVDSINQCTGGGGTNTAAAFSKMGLKTGWIGKLGDDHSSKAILEELKGVKFLGKRAHGNAGYSVILTGTGNDRSILTFKGLNDKLSSKDVQWSQLKTRWFYASSMLGESFSTLVKMKKFASKNDIKFAFNPSSYIASWGLKKLKPVLQDLDVLILNKEEAGLLLGKQQDVRMMLSRLQEYSKIVVITDGKNGAYAFNGIETYRLIPRNVAVVETTGAGDSFAAGVVAALIKNKEIDYALQIGAAQSANVIQHVGAKNKLLSWNEAVTYAKKYPSKVLRC